MAVNVQEIKKDASRHVALCMCVFVGILCIARCVMAIMKTPYSLAIGLPIAVGFVYAVFETVIVTMVWLRTATLHLDRLQVFHTASSGFRILVVLVILLIEYLCVGRSGIIPYFLWMVGYYLVALVLHTVFFTRENSKLFSK